MDWKEVPGYREADPTHEVIRRYARLSPFELRALRDRLRTLAERAERKQPDRPLDAGDPIETFEAAFGGRYCQRLARMCELVLSWYPEAAEWEWGQIIGNETLRGYAKVVRRALQSYPDEDTPTKIFRIASAYHGYAPERHARAIKEYRQEKMQRQSFPKMSDLEAVIETLSEGYEQEAPRQRVGNQYRDAGWSGADGGRVELEKLTEAILWATETESEDLDSPSLRVEVSEEVQPESIAQKKGSL